MPAWRPDLADSPGLDVYNHLRPGTSQFALTVERFRYLVEHDLLTASERAAIMAGRGDKHRWLRDVLEGREPHPPPVRFDDLDPWVDLYRDVKAK